MFQEFKKFIARGNVIDLAVGVIVGAAFGAITTSLVNDVVMPVIGVVVGGVDFSELFIVLSTGTAETRPSTLAEATAAGAATINYGKFINTVLNFLIISFVVFMLVKGVNQLRHEKEKEDEVRAAAPPVPPEEVLLLREIRDALKR